MNKFVLIFLLAAGMLAGRGASGQALVSNFTVSHQTGCAPLVDSFTDISTGNPVSWSWNFGNGYTSAFQNPTTSYTAAGTFTVTLTVTNSAGQTSTSTKTVTINPAPVATFTVNDSDICPGTTVNFTSSINFNNGGNPGTIIWNINGSTASTPTTSYTYTTPGLYTVSLAVSNALGCTTTVFKPNYVLVYTPAAVTISASPQTICTVPGSSTFTAATTGTPAFSYNWNFGDGGTGSGSPVTHNYTAAGSYPVSVITTDGHGCVDTTSYGNMTVIHLAPAFSGPLSICQNDYATFQSTTPGATSATWSFGDGTSGSGLQTTHTYTTPGTYQVLMTASTGICSDTVSRTLVVNPRPVTNFSYTPLNPCPAPASIQFTTTNTVPSTYAWSFGDNTFGTGPSPLHTYYQNGDDTVIMVATSAAGCTASVFHIITIYPLNANIILQPKAGCIPLSVHFGATVTSMVGGNSITYPFGVQSYQWSFGDGSTSTADSGTHLYTAVGTYPVTLTVTTGNGCTITVHDSVRTGTKPTAGFYAGPDTICVHQMVYFTDSSQGTIDSWEWYFGDGGFAYSQNTPHIFTNAGVFDITHSAGYHGCKDTLVKPHYIVVLDPKAQYTPHFQCDTPTKVVFQNTTVNATSMYWIFGDGTTSTVTSPTHYYPSLGTYTVMLITHNSITGCTDTGTTVILLQHLTPNFTASDTTVCAGDFVTLTSSVSGGIAYGYRWFIDGVQIDTTANLAYQFYSPGQHTIALETKDSYNCLDTVTKVNYITVGHPVAVISAPVFACAPATLTLTDASTYPAGTSYTSRLWDYGDGTSGSPPTAAISHYYANAGTYTLRLVVTDNIGCKDSTTLGINLGHVVPDFSALNVTPCAGSPVFFNNLSAGGTQYKWSFGDGDTSTALSPSHAYAQPGTYTVRLVVSNGSGCKDSITKLAYITVQPKPHAAFTLSDTFSICPPLIVQTTNNSTGASTYAWNFGNTATSTLANPVATYPASGIYNVVLVATSGAGCKDTAYGRVRILGYAGVLSYTPLTGCAPLTVTFTANNVSNVPGFIFDFGDGSTQASTSTTVTHTYTQPGPHVPKLIMTNNSGCASTSIGLDTIKVDGIIAGFTFNPYPACVSGTLTFLDTSRGAYSAIASHSWIFHDGSTAGGLSPTHAYNGPGTYPVTLITTTAAGCRDTLHSSVTFWNLPVIGAGPDTTICLTDSATLHPSGGVTYAWSPAATLSCAGCSNPSAFPTTQTQYVVVGTDAHGCKNSDSVIVKIKTKTTGHIGPGGEVCAGVPVRLLASGGNTYTWLPPTGLDNSTAASPIATPPASTHYLVIIKEGRCIPDSQYVDVTVHPLPLVDAGPDQTIIAGNAAQLQATGSSYITGWAWTPVAGLSCTTCDNPEATPDNTTTYIVTARTDFDCEASDSVTVFIICDHSQIFIPNTFTPNGNGRNDKFYVHGKGIRAVKFFRVYDRWGEIVFERANINVDDEQQGWDGTFKGKELPPDVYVYLVDAVCDTGEESQWKGDVMLLR